MKLHDVDIVRVASAAYWIDHGTPTPPRRLAQHEWLAPTVVPSPWTLPLL